MTAAVTLPAFTAAELVAITLALRARRAELVERRDTALQLSTHSGLVLTPERFREWAAEHEVAIAEVDAIKAKLLDWLQRGWDGIGAADAEAVAS